VDYNKFCGEILKLHPKIRFAGVYNTKSSDIYYKMQKGIKKIFTDEQTKDSLIHGYMRWKSRLHASEFIGTPIYTMTKYPKINRITLPCGGKAILMISTETELEPTDFIEDVCKLREKFEDPKDYVEPSHQLSF